MGEVTSAPAHRSWKSFCHALFNRESGWLVWKDILRGTTIKSELSVAFTGWGDDIDKTDNPGAEETAFQTSAYGERLQHLYSKNTAKVNLFKLNYQKINCIFL